MWRAPAILVVFASGCASDPAPAKLAAVDDGGGDVASVTIPGAPVGEIGMTTTLHVTNLGKRASGPLAVAITGDAATDFTLDAATTCNTRTLAADERCDVVVKFLPARGGDRIATLSVTGTPGGAVDVALNGSGIAPTIQIQASLDFHVVEVGIQAIEQITVQNTGTTLGHIGTLKVVGPNFGRSNTSCNAIILGQSSCTIDLGFVPPAVGLESGSLVVGVSGTDYTVALSGTGGGRVTVARAGAGTGAVTSAPAGIECGATCTMLATGDVVLTATPAGGSTFGGWSLAGCTGTTCTVPSSGSPQTITATFN